MTSTPNSDGCVVWNPSIFGHSVYGYKPSFDVGVSFCTLFGVSLLVHSVQTLWKKQWWLVAFVLGALTELLGWAGRVWSSQCPYNRTAFLVQITTLIIGPTFIAAGSYVILGKLIQSYGQQYSWLTPKQYLYFFCGVDLICLVIQATGGGLAATAFAQDPPKDTRNGTNIMVAGILFQLASLCTFALLFGRVLWKLCMVHHKGALALGRPEDRKLWILTVATAFSMAMLVARGIYRAIELLQGWQGYLITREVYFVALDGALMVAATGVFNIFNPAYLIGAPSKVTSSADGEAEVWIGLGDAYVAR